MNEHSQSFQSSSTERIEKCLETESHSLYSLPKRTVLSAL